MTNLENKARAYRNLQAQIKALEEGAANLKQEMINELDARKIDELTAGEYTIRYGLYEIDTTRLKSENANLYNQYAKSMVSTRFSVA